MYTKPNWLCFSDLRNHLKGEPVLDWLDLFGTKLGYKPSEAHPADFSQFIMRQGQAFEDWVVQEVLRPCFGEDQFCDLSRFSRFQSKQHLKHSTAALEDGVATVIFQPLVQDAKRKWFGHPDLLVHASAMPTMLRAVNRAAGRDEEAFVAGWDAFVPNHWVIVDIKFSSQLENKPLYQAQLYMYQQMLNSMLPSEQEQTEWPELFLLGRKGELVPGFSSGRQLEATKLAVKAACEWVRLLHDKKQSQKWVAEPQASVAELRALSAGSRFDGSRWDTVCDHLAEAQGDVTMVMKVGPAARSKLGFPAKPWFDPSCDARYLLGARVKDEDEVWLNDMLSSARQLRAGASGDARWPKVPWDTIAPGAARAVDMQLVFVDFEFAYDLHLCRQFKTDTLSWTFGVASAGSTYAPPGLPAHPYVDCLRDTEGQLSSAAELQMWGRWLSWLQTHHLSGHTVYLVHWTSADAQCFERMKKKVAALPDGDASLPGDLASSLQWVERCVVWVDMYSGLLKSKTVLPGCMNYGLKTAYSRLPAAVRAATELTAGGLGITADRAAAAAYLLHQAKRLGAEPDQLMEDVMKYNVDDVLMMRAVWETVVEL